MAWKPEHEEARKAREAANPDLRAKRLQSAKSSQERNREARKGYMKAYYEANPEKFGRRTPEQRAAFNAKRRAKYAANAEWRDAHKMTVKDWQKANPIKRQAQRLRKYNMTPEQHSQMLEAQKGVCAICRTAPHGAKNFPMVDHCHASGRVRGLLCSNCNQALGKFKDDPDLLRAAIAYLSNLGSSGAS